MSSISDPPSGSFQLSMLINDTRYRSYTFQFVALLLLIMAFAYLGYNLISNLQAAGLNISYQFLGEPAGYDINQTLIPYTSQSTHWQASLVGVLNTLLVALLGCLMATIIGVVVGVLRLSNNWLVRQLMSVYVEIFRNVPVLIWILIIMAIFVAVLPQPRDFRGDDPEATMVLGAFAFTGRGFYSPAPIFGPLSGIVIAVFLASIAGIFALRSYAKKALFDRGQVIKTFWPSVAIFFLPTIIVYFVLGRPITLEYPALTGFNFQGGIFMRNSLISLWFALSIYTAAFIAENVRAGILAVSKGQTEAAASLGLRPGRIMNLVVLPQALRVIVPPLISQYLNLTKNSSLAIAVGYMDLTGTLGGITLNQTGRAIEAIFLLMLFYLAISLAISAIMNVYNNSVRLKER
ncbi:ABC transporter permease subunit [Marivita sp.]|uniref:amino acid ABC transporter permease n=1 Tax=Marivita sp. TaxID=2003365 RepID=UPI0025BDCFE6|nr:ABC transporter permease subunit [Marivita sp.]